MDTSSGLQYEERGPVAYLTLNRPEKRNALSAALVRDLAANIERLAGVSHIRCVVLGAAGGVFSSGHDLREITKASAAELTEIFANCSRMMLGLRKLPQPVIAKVQGMATAAGCQLVAACDLAIAVDSATFATPGARIGLFCTTPMVPLVRTIAPRAAMEMLLTGAPITARRAYELGLVNRVVPAAELDAAVQSLVDALLVNSPNALAIGKAAFYDQLPMDESRAYGRATEVMIDNAQRPDAREGIDAFLGKRKPVWH
jgi:enoyl-CoA hydratase/carnithine racemase